LDLWVHDAIVTNQSLVHSLQHKILPVHSTPPKLLSLVAFIIVELFLEKMEFECHNLLSFDDQGFIYFCHDFDTTGWYLIPSPHLLVLATNERRVPALVATSGFHGLK
jgi:hypothetical protein